MTNFSIVIVLVLIVLGFGVTVYILLNEMKKLQKPQNEEAQRMLWETMQQMKTEVGTNLKDVRSSLNTNTEQLNQKLLQQNEVLGKRLDNAARAVMEVSKSMEGVQKEVGIMSEIGHSMKSLQDFLKSPKLRGNIGEQVLADLLAQMLPNEAYALQFEFKDGQKCDAVLRVSEGLIPVDAKFPLENFMAMVRTENDADRARVKKDFESDVKKHISDIAKKYILPSEGTVDFALMYIPSEAIYYEIVVNSEDLTRVAWEKRVLPVSPNVFYSYLKAILIGLEGKQVEERAKQILAAIRSIDHDAEKFGENLRVMTKHVTNAKNSADEVTSSFNQLNQRLTSLNSLNSPEDPLQKQLLD